MATENFSITEKYEVLKKEMDALNMFVQSGYFELIGDEHFPTIVELNGKDFLTTKRIEAIKNRITILHQVGTGAVELALPAIVAISNYVAEIWKLLATLPSGNTTKESAVLMANGNLRTAIDTAIRYGLAGLLDPEKLPMLRLLPENDMTLLVIEALGNKLRSLQELRGQLKIGHKTGFNGEESSETAAIVDEQIRAVVVEIETQTRLLGKQK